MNIRLEINNNTIIVGDDNTLVILMDKLSRMKIYKEIMALKATLDQFNLIDIYTTFHLNAADYTLFSNDINFF